MNDWKEKIAFKGDKILWYIVIMLMIASVMVVYSSTGRLAYNEKAGNTFFYLQPLGVRISTEPGDGSVCL